MHLVYGMSVTDLLAGLRNGPRPRAPPQAEHNGSCASKEGCAFAAKSSTFKLAAQPSPPLLLPSLLEPSAASLSRIGVVKNKFVVSRGHNTFHALVVLWFTMAYITSSCFDLTSRHSPTERGLQCAPEKSLAKIQTLCADVYQSIGSTLRRCCPSFGKLL
eukprot:1873468-Amphidinium_carterae.1